LVTLDGYTLLPGINVPQAARNLTIGPDGTVSALAGNQTAPTQAPQLHPITLLNPPGLDPLRHNLHSQSHPARPPQVGIAGQNGFGSISQGFLEMPNASTVQELVGLIEAQRAYEASSKAVQVADQMQGMANGLIK